MTTQNNHPSPTGVNTPIVLTIAGSDSGGAGIQADIKTISATGSFACSAITAITSQNTQGVSAIFPIPLDHLESQIDAVFTDLNIAAVKVGMLTDSGIIKVVASKIKQYKPKYLVVDPVMVANSGDLLLEESPISTLKAELLPLADVITPNLPEGEADMESMIDQLRSLGCQSLLLKGGHLESSEYSTDLLIFPDKVESLNAKRVDTQNTHGSGL
jgi:hydroxymethylpyrimidine/phosphomethylpyrimidine kinase